MYRVGEIVEVETMRLDWENELSIDVEHFLLSSEWQLTSVRFIGKSSNPLRVSDLQRHPK